VSGLQQLAHDMSTNESSATCNQTLHSAHANHPMLNR